MGLIGNLVNKVKSVASDIKKVYQGGDVSPSQGKIATGIINAAATLGQSFNPFSPLKPQTNIKNPTLNKVADTLVKHPYISAGIVAGGVTAIKNPKTAVSAIKSILPQTTKGKVIAGISAPVVIGAVAQNPTKAATSLVNAPSELFNLGSDLSKVAANPTKENIKELITESPILLGTGALLTGGAILKATSGIANTLAVNELTETIKENPNQGFLVTDKSGEIKTNTLSPISPVTPKTNNISSTSTRARRARRRKTTPPLNISQKVNIMVSQSQNKKYIKLFGLPNRWVSTH